MKAQLSLLLLLFLVACRPTPTTPYEYALLSADVYDDNDIEALPDHFESFLSFDEDDFRSSVSFDGEKIKYMKEHDQWGKLIMHVAGKFISRGGYFGRAYINEKNNQLIIAHRGTDLDIALDNFDMDDLSIKLDEGNLLDLIKDLDDDIDIFNGRIPQQQFEAAQYFTKVVKEKYTQQYNSEPQIIHTGHSLGAVLAELCSLKDQCKAVTFESPGTKPMVDQLEIENLNLAKADITSYNAAPNKINSLHEHLGTVIPLYDTTETLSAYSTEELSSLKQHSIKDLLKRFDRESGGVKK